MTTEVRRGLETYQEGTIYLPHWREVFPAEFSRIFSQFEIEVGKDTYKRLQRLGFKIEKDGASEQLLRILPTTGDYPQLVFRIYEGRGIKLISNNQNRSDRDWLKRIDVAFDDGISGGDRLGLTLGSEVDVDGRNFNYLKLKREYVLEQAEGEFYVNIAHGPGLILDASVR